MLATDKGGNTSWKARAESFGKVVSESGTLQLNLRFPGQYYDKETGTHYNYYRDYNPITGRYLQSDPVGLKGGDNIYIYTENNPLNLMDNMGLLSSVDACKSPRNIESCIEAGMLSRPVTSLPKPAAGRPPPYVFPEGCNEACKNAIIDASNAYWTLTTKRMPQYASGGTRGRDDNHARSILELQAALKKAIKKVKTYCTILPPMLPEWERAANEPLPK
jgi:RHS repeat-associated protein